MAESERINRRKNIMLFTNNTGRASYKSGSVATYEFYTSRIVGGVEAGLMPESDPFPGTYNLSSELIRAFGLVLTGAAASNLGPTRSSRRYYLWFFAVATAYQWITSEKVVNGTKDNWNWDIQHAFGTEREVCIWMLQALETIMSKMSIAYSAPWDQVASTYILSASALDALKGDVAGAAELSTWQGAYNTWWATRSADGSTEAAVPPTDGELPNGATRLDVSLTVDPATFPRPESWTPLKVGASSQKYMTYNWLNVTSPALTAGNQTSIAAAADSYYPSSAQRTTEIDEVVTITNGLTDTEKVIAEFWAGGPFTVSPPGMLLWMWKTYVAMKSIAPVTVIWSGLDLALHLFETGRLVWGLKKSHMQARPIQEIRRLYRGQTVTKYDGTSIFGESWVPYQETNFVTPPFADFPSGHSAFSRSFANVMNMWFGMTIDSSMEASMTDISLISPAMKSQTHPFGTFSFDTGASLIQPAVVPAQSVFLSWTTWDDLAESAGISRKYGGIHATSAHTGSVALANALHTALQANFPLFV
jgi:hypothetical protein